MSEWVAEIRRTAATGGVISRHETTFTVTEVIDGHVWCNDDSGMIQWEHCTICGMIRRRDKMNKPCRGQAKLTLR